MRRTVVVVQRTGKAVGVARNHQKGQTDCVLIAALGQGGLAGWPPLSLQRDQ